MATPQTIDLGGARLRWPTTVFAAELEAVIRADSAADAPSRVDDLIQEAFDDHDELLRLLESGMDWTTRGDYLTALLDHAKAGNLHRFEAAARWKERSGVAQQAPTAVNSFPTELAKVLQDLDAQGYWDDAACPPCVDDAFETLEHLGDIVERELGTALDLKFMPRALHGSAEDVESVTDLSDDDLFELVEIFHDLAARPRCKSYHQYGFHWHYWEFSKQTGQAIYRWRINAILQKEQSPYRLADEGELKGRLISVVDDGRQELMSAATESATPGDKSRLDHANALFLKRGATREDKRSAVRELADLLENRRGLLQEHLSQKDEGALFQIANEFEIRHYNKRQQGDYDEAFLDWIFWWYLATVELAQRLASRQQNSGSIV